MAEEGPKDEAVPQKKSTTTSNLASPRDKNSRSPLGMSSSENSRMTVGIPNSGNSMTMAMVGCLPDNVQQAIRSFSIKPGKQHITFCFPFMADILRRFRSDTTSGGVDHAASATSVTHALFFDHSMEVIEGYQSFATFAPVADRNVMPVVLFTLYQKGRRDCILRHFESLVKVILNNKTPLSVWKMPIVVTDLDKKQLQEVEDTVTKTILDIQMENLQNTFEGKAREELYTLVKDKMVTPNVWTYQDCLQCHVKEVISHLRSIPPERFLSIIDQLRSVNCTVIDFQKADIMMKHPSVDPLIYNFWKIWGQDQVACKVFPVAIATFGFQGIGAMVTHPYGATVQGGALIIDGGNLGGCFTNLPVKEGLQSVIKCLKAQDTSSTGGSETPGRFGGCSCCACRSPSLYGTDVVCNSPCHVMSAPSVPSGYFEAQSAFYRPRPNLTPAVADSSTTTPYSDALKAAAVLPAGSELGDNTPRSGAGAVDSVNFLRNGIRRGYLPVHAHAQSAIPPIYFSPDPALIGSLHHKANSLAVLRKPHYPVVYRPKILTHSVDYFTRKK